MLADRRAGIMDIFTTIGALFSGERVSHADTFILAGVVLFAAFVFSKIRRHFKARKKACRAGVSLVSSK